MKAISRRGRVVLGVLVLAAAVAAFWYLRQDSTPQQVEAPTVKTARVRSGDIVILAQGSGSLVAAQEANLGFKSGERLVELLVQVGDRVDAGQGLARIDDTAAKAQVAQAEISLRNAELKLSEIKRQPEAASILSAQDNLASAQAALQALTAGPSVQDIAVAEADLKFAEINVQAAQAAYDRVSYRPDIAGSKEAMALQQATLAYEKARATYDQRLAGPGADQLAAARARVSAAQAQLDNLLAGAGAEDLELAQLTVSQARNTLQSATAQLEATVLRAPFAGTVTAIKANVGELLGSSPLVSLMATTPAQVRFTIEESDLAQVNVGDAASITFNALPDNSYRATVVFISPALSLVGGVPAAEVVAELESVDDPSSWLRVGMSAEVEVSAAEARGVLLVPAEAVRELAPGSYAVFVVREDGALEMRVVTTGLRDWTNVEITSGLARGDVVSTGTVETQ